MTSNTSRTFTPSAELLKIRKEIDANNQILADILCQRLLLVQQAAQFKPTRADVRLPERVEEIIQNVIPIADKYQIERHYLENIFRFLIEESIQYEERVWQQLNTPENNHTE